MARTPVKSPVKDSLRWLECCHCSGLYCNADETTHKAWCQLLNSQEMKQRDQNHPEHSIIFGECLTARVSVVNDRKNFPENWKVGCVFLNPETVTALHLVDQCLGRPVLVDRNSAFRLWPDQSVPLTSIGIHCEGLQRLLNSDGRGKSGTEENFLELVALRRDVVAEEIFFELLEDPASYGNEVFDRIKFKDAFMYYNEDRIFSLGEIVKFSYAGTLHTLKVRKAKVAGMYYRCEDSEKTANQMAECFSRMQISANQEEDTIFRFFSLKSSTSMFFLMGNLKTHSFGGYKSMRRKLKNMLECVFHQQISAEERPIIRSMLLYGPPGIGKTMIVHDLADTMDVPLFHVLPEHSHEREHLSSLKNSILNEKSCIVFINDIDAVCPKKDSEATYAVRELIKCLLEKRNAFVFGATNKREEIHEAILQPNYIGVAQKMAMPTVEDKIDIFNCVLRSFRHSLSANDIEELAKRTQYFSGYDISTLCKKAMVGLRFCPDGKRNSECASLSLALSDLVSCLPDIEPYMMRSLQLDLPFVKVIRSGVTWNDVGGLRDIKQIADQMIRLRVHQPQVFERLGLQPLRGLLMFGPPGCSKTMVANAVASECAINFLAVEGTSVFSKFVGSTEANIAKLFRRAREIAPSVIFFDEIETLAQNRNQDTTPGGSYQNRALQQMLVELDGISASDDIVCVLAATNRPELLDRAFFRPGRFDRVVYIPLPNNDTRRDILLISLQRLKILQDMPIDQIVLKTQGYSSVEICELVRVAVQKMQADSDHSKVPVELQMMHFEFALEKIRPRTTHEQIAILETFASQNIH